MIITPEIFNSIEKIRKHLRGSESISLGDKGIVITGKPKNRSEARRLEALQRKYNTIKEVVSS